MVLEERSPRLLQGSMDEPGKHGEHRRKKNLQSNLGFLDVDRCSDRLTHGGDVEVELVTNPSRLNLGAAGDVFVKMVNVGGDTASRFLLSELVRKVDFDGLSH